MKEVNQTSVGAGKVLASLVIVGVLGLQGLAGFSGNWRFSSYYWPFLSYPMYRFAHYVGDRIDVRFPVFFTLEDGRELEVFPEDLGLDYWKFMRNFKSAIQNEDAQMLDVYIREYQRRTGHRVVHLRLENYPLVLSSDGGRSAPSEVLKEITFDHPTDTSN